MIQKNVFHKGSVSDIDYSRIDNQQWVFPTLNFRVFNKKGQGFVGTFMKGNQKVFSIKKDYYIIGAKEKDGIVFIFSTNGTRGEIGCYPSPKAYYANNNLLPNDNYPIIETGYTGFERRYKALPNYIYDQEITTTSPAKYHFNTSLFAFKKNYVLDIVIREDYDGSYNIYFTDFNNPLRVINTGFDKEGNLIQRYYNEESFPNMISVIPGTDKTLRLQTLNGHSGVRVEDGGEVKSGNYIVYVGYMDANFTPTPYLFESMPIQVYGNSFDNGEYQVQGQPGETGHDNSEKKITLYLDNIDTQYKYLNVALIRYYSSTNQPVLSEYYGLVEPTLITGEQMPITIVNHNNTEPLTIGDILKPLNTERCVKTITEVNNILFGGNWKSPTYHNEEFIEFAKKIEIYPDTSLMLDKKLLGDGTDYNMSEKSQYKNYLTLYDNVGYFRSEPYGFCVFYEMKDGTTTQGYKCRGIDALNLSLYDIIQTYNGATGTDQTIINEDGMFRFPKIENAPTMIDNKISVMGVKFIMDKALTYLNSLPESSFIKNNVRSIKFGRTNRFENLRYQGLTYHASRARGNYEKDKILTLRYRDFDYYNEHLYTYTFLQDLRLRKESSYIIPEGVRYRETDLALDSNYALKGTTYTEYTNKEASAKLSPVYCGHLPCMYSDDSGEFSEYSKHTLMIRQIPLSLENGIFYSPDLLFDLNSDVSNINYLEEQGLITFLRTQAAEDTSTEARPYPKYTLHQQHNLEILSSHKTISNLDFTFIKDNITPDTSLDFCSRATDLWTGLGETTTFVYAKKTSGTTKRFCNRDYQAKKFIGFKTNVTNTGKYYKDEDYQFRNANYQDRIVNLYRSKPEDINISELFIQNNPYYTISKAIELTTILEKAEERKAYGITVYRGDCFLQLTYFKQAGWFESKWISTYKSLKSIDGEQVFNEIGSTTNKQYHTHGMVFSIVTENKNNIAMRHNTDDYNEYLPHLNNDFGLHIKTPNSKANGNEQYLLNTGYNRTLGEFVFSLYDEKIPYYPEKRPTRIRWADFHIPYSYIDNWKLWDVNAYRDYDFKEGEIIKLGELNNTLISIQERAINEHFLRDGKLELDDNQADIVLGNPLLLSEIAKKISNFGSQHLKGVLFTDNLCYGFDFEKGIVWNIGSSQSEYTKKIVLEANNLSSQLYIEKEINDFKKPYYELSDKTTKLDEDIYNGNGVLIGYNKDYSEVYITIKYNIYNEQHEKTLVFSEKGNYFTGEASFYPDFYLSLIKNILSYKKNINGVFMHDINENLLEFYNEQHKGIISYIVNGITEGADSFTKQFYSSEIQSLDIPFTKVLYKTQYQEGELNPFIDSSRFWEEPIYEENRWKIPMSVANDGDGDFEIDSQMTGEWLRVSIEYESDIETYIKSIHTHFNISKT